MDKWISNNSIFIGCSPQKIVSITAYGEARGESDEGVQAVINVICNRVKDPKYFAYKPILAISSNKFAAVCLKKWQFSCFNLNDPNRNKLVSIASNWSDAVLNNNRLSDICKIIVDDNKLNNLPDITDGAEFYFVKNMKNPPSWRNDMKFTKQIGMHVFYKR